eukprot:s597_g9.t1
MEARRAPRRSAKTCGGGVQPMWCRLRRRGSILQPMWSAQTQVEMTLCQACETNHHQPHPRHGGQTVRRTFHCVRFLVNSNFNWVFFNSSCRAFRTFWCSLWREIPALPCRHYQWRRYRRLQCRQSWQLPMRRQCLRF